MALFSAVGIAGALGVASTSFIAIGAAAGLNALVGIGLNKLALKLAGADSRDTGFGVKGELQRGADIPQSFLFGKSATAGSLEYANEWAGDADTPNAFFSMVITLSDLPISSLDAVWVNGQKGTIAAVPHVLFGHPIEEFHKDGSDHVWVRFYDGTQTSADQMLVDNVSTAERPWDATAIGTGTAYAVVTCKVNQELFSGFPTFLFECTGAKLYDPSQDSSVGGSGSQRWDTPSSWGGDGDHLPAVQLYNLLRGIRYGSDWLYGAQATTGAQLPTAHWITQINKCRAEIAAAGGNEPTYRSGGEVPVGTPVTDVVEALLDACQGRLSEAGGVYKLFVGAPDAAVATFTDGDILSTDEQRFTPFFGLADTVNGISAKYPDPEQGWQAETAPPLNRPDLEIKDGSRRLMADIEFSLVPYGEQVQRLMLSALNEATRARRHTFSLPPRFWALEPGDVVSWSSERNGYVSKLFRVDGVMDQPNANIIVDLTEIDPSDYSFDTNSDYTPVGSGSVSGGLVPPQSVIGWSASATSIPDGNGNGVLPAILVQWAGSLPDVIAVRVQVRIAGTTDLIADERIEEVAAGEGVISQAILASTSYEVRGKYIPGTPRDTEWSAWLPVTTLNIGFGSGANDTPKAPTNLTVAGFYQQIGLAWDAVTQNTDSSPITDLDGYNIYRSTSSNFATAIYVGTSKGNSYTDAGLPNETTFHYWVKAVDTAGNESAASNSDFAATALIDVDQLIEDFRTQIGAARIDIVSSLPSGSGYEVGDFVFLTTDKKLYEWNGSAFVAAVGDIPNGSVVADMIASGAVTGDKIPSSAVSQTKIQDGAVSTGKLAAFAITAAKIASGAITTAKIFAGAITADKIATNAVTADKILANAVTAGKIAAGAVTAATLAASNVITSSAQIANGIITNAKIANAAITAAKIGTAAITNAKIGDLEVNTIKIADGSITGRDSATDVGTRTINTTTPTDLMSPSQYVLVDSGSQTADALIVIQFDFSRNTGTDAHFFRLVRGSTVLKVWSLDDFQKDRTSGTISVTYVDYNHGSGSKSYFVQGYRDAGVSVGCQWSNITVMGAAWRR